MTRGAQSPARPDAQLRLQFPQAGEDAGPLIATGTYRDVVAALRRWKAWPDREMCLTGPGRSGKSRLLRAWAAEAGAALVTGEALSSASMRAISGLSVAALAVDDADKCLRGEALLAAINLCRERGGAFLMSGRSPAPEWMLDPRDLRSRLVAFPQIRIDEPDSEALKARLVAACKLRYMRLPTATADYMALRLPRTHAVIDLAAEALEAEAQGKGLTRTVARRAIQKIQVSPEGR